VVALIRRRSIELKVCCRSVTPQAGSFRFLTDELRYENS
jgi:hypothetical protein